MAKGIIKGQFNPRSVAANIFDKLEEVGIRRTDIMIDWGGRKTGQT